MVCVNCGVSVNNFGVYKGNNTIHCTNCGIDFDFRTEEIILKASRSQARRIVYQKGLPVLEFDKDRG